MTTITWRGKARATAVAAVAMLTLPLVVPLTGPAPAAAAEPVTAGTAMGEPPATGPVAAPPPAGPWVGTWQTAQQVPMGATWQGPNWSLQGFADQSVRQVVRISLGGSRVRVRLSNVFGQAPLRLAGATLGRAGTGAAIRPDTLRALRFRHSRSTVIPAGAEAFSDPVALRVPALDRLAVTLYFAEPTGPATFHEFAAQTAYRAAGDRRVDESATAFTETTRSWYYLAGVDVAGRAAGTAGVGGAGGRHSVVTVGDSITDGVGVTWDADNRYPDQLAERLAAARRPIGVLNAGIGGNRILNDSPCFGRRAPDRFARDALGQTGARTVVVLEGINDIGFPHWIDPCTEPRPEVTAEQMIDGYRQLIGAARARGLKIVGATLTPFKGAGYYSERGETVRDAVNAWIRTGGEFDAVVDLDRALADPADPDRLRPEYDAGDRLHPSDAGFEAMAAAFDLAQL